jgi:hypothetical protein
MVSSDELFLRYSFPCAHVLLELGSMSKERYSELERAAKNGEAPSRDVLESSFPAAFRRIKGLSEEMGIEDYWDMRVMKEYWHRNHNVVIDEGEGNYARFPESFRDFCKVHVAEVVEILPDGFLLIEYDGKRRPVCSDYVLGVGVGEVVRVHHAYAVEKAN